MKHASIETITQVDEETDHIVEDVYTTDETVPKRVIVRTRKKLRSDRLTLLADYIGCLDVMKQGKTTELTVYLKQEADGMIRIEKTWLEAINGN